NEESNVVQGTSIEELPTCLSIEWRPLFDVSEMYSLADPVLSRRAIRSRAMLLNPFVRALRASKLAAVGSGSKARTEPAPLLAASKENHPMFAPASTAIDPGLTSFATS